MKELLNNLKLLNSGVVANNRMNRERGISGSNSYQKDLSFDVAAFLQKRLVDDKSAAWLDICCGEGRALIEAAENFVEKERAENCSRFPQIVGIDLAGIFRKYSSELKFLTLLETPVEDFAPTQKFDLITCVHGLHYIGDKLLIIQNAANWLTEDGFFLANFDVQSLKLADNSRAMFSDFLRDQGFSIDKRKKLIALKGRRAFNLPFEFVGADDKAGPNYTGQPAVDSYYKTSKREKN